MRHKTQFEISLEVKAERAASLGMSGHEYDKYLSSLNKKTPSWADLGYGPVGIGFSETLADRNT